MRTILVTGGAGFIGSDFVRLLIAERPDVAVVNLDLLTYAGNLANLRECSADPRYTFVRGDVRDAATVRSVLAEHDAAAIVHFAAESHVDRSILGPRVFAETNVLGTLTLLSAAREAGVGRFLQVSTDEVYGSLGPGSLGPGSLGPGSLGPGSLGPGSLGPGSLGPGARFSESSPIAPNSPYSASKAAADHFVSAFGRTYGMDVVITRCSNNYGPYQFPEKLIPLMIHRALRDEALPVYGDGLQVRDWIWVRDHSTAILHALERGAAGEVYNIGAENDCTNLHVVRTILDALGKPQALIRHVEDRPGHDRRYAIDATKIRRELGWTPSLEFEDGIARTIRWYQENGEWLAGVTSGEYERYYDEWYRGR